MIEAGPRAAGAVPEGNAQTNFLSGVTSRICTEPAQSFGSLMPLGHQLAITVLPFANRSASCTTKSLMSGTSFWESSQTVSPAGLISRAKPRLLPTNVLPFFSRTADHGDGTATDQICFPSASYSATSALSICATRKVP